MEWQTRASRLSPLASYAQRQPVIFAYRVNQVRSQRAQDTLNADSSCTARVSCIGVRSGGAALGPKAWVWIRKALLGAVDAVMKMHVDKQDFWICGGTIGLGGSVAPYAACEAVQLVP